MRMVPAHQPKQASLLQVQLVRYLVTVIRKQLIQLLWKACHPKGVNQGRKAVREAGDVTSETL